MVWRGFGIISFSIIADVHEGFAPQMRLDITKRSKRTASFASGRHPFVKDRAVRLR